MGFSEYDPEKPQPMDELIRIADEKMYEEKKKKKMYCLTFQRMFLII